jgi:hypothetical protein
MKKTEAWKVIAECKCTKSRSSCNRSSRHGRWYSPSSFLFSLIWCTPYRLILSPLSNIAIYPIPSFRKSPPSVSHRLLVKDRFSVTLLLHPSPTHRYTVRSSTQRFTITVHVIVFRAGPSKNSAQGKMNVCRLRKKKLSSRFNLGSPPIFYATYLQKKIF